MQSYISLGHPGRLEQKPGKRGPRPSPARPRIAAEGCDIEALIHSEMGRQMVLQFEDYIRYGDRMDPAYVQKWRAGRLDKQ